MPDADEKVCPGYRADNGAVVWGLRFSFCTGMPDAPALTDRRLLRSPTPLPPCNNATLRPATKQSNVRSPLGGVTFRRPSITPVGRSRTPSSLHLLSMSLSRILPLCSSSKMSNRIFREATNCFGSPSYTSAMFWLDMLAARRMCISVIIAGTPLSFHYTPCLHR